MTRCERRRGHFRLATPVVLLLAGLLLPGVAMAWPAKYNSCSQGGCHVNVDADATFLTAVNGIVGTSGTVAPGATFEIDYIVNNVSGNGVMGVEIAVPSGWTVQAGTSNSPGIAGWNTVWDAAAGQGWDATQFDTSAEFPTAPVGHTVRFSSTGWDSGGRDAAFDDASAGDLDGTANHMGMDARVTVPGGTADGSYTVYVLGVGHEGNKAHATQAITITVSSGGGDSTPPTPGTVSVSPEVASTYVPAAFTITTPFSDADSAVTGCEYTLNGGGVWSNGTVGGSLPNFTCTANVAGQSDGASLTVNMRATSGGGIGTAGAIARTVDAAAPTTGDNAPAGWQNANQTVTLTPNDGTGSGVAGTDYCVDTSNSCVPGTAGTSVSVTQTAGTAGTQYVRYRSTDNLGNLEATRSATVQIDRAVPVDGTLSITPGNTQNSLTWSAASDSGSGLRTGTIYDVRFLAGGTAPTCATGTSLYTGDNLFYTHTGLTNGNPYSYRVCAYDNVNNVSAGAFGTGTPALVNSPPNNPPGASLVQYQSDGTTPVTAGAFTASASPVMKATVTDPDSDNVQLEVEIRPIASAFTNAPNCTSGPAVASGTTAQATCGPLPDGLYKWQARAKDSNGDTSAWVQY